MRRLVQKLADRIEAVVGNEAQFLASFDANSPQICIKCEILKFA
jgi:hypothetical protein